MTVTVGELLITLLEGHGVDFVFGIPGVHTIELYRGLANSRIRHITPRHEQGAGFMADGYSRVSSKPGVAFVITGPGLTNTITAMAQARADSVPMLVVAGVNARDTLGKGLGCLHELPNQLAMLATVALKADRVENGEELPRIIDEAFSLFASSRPGPAFIEIPIDVMSLPAPRSDRPHFVPPQVPLPLQEQLKEAAGLMSAARKPVILAGGGAKRAGRSLVALAERLNAPVVTTINGRGLMHGHELGVPASASLAPVRALIAEADLVIAVGTELGPTDYDMYVDGGWAVPDNLIRIDIEPEQVNRHPARLGIVGDAPAVLEALVETAPAVEGNGRSRARSAREQAFAALSQTMQNRVRILEAVRDTLPGSIIVGDSTQIIYAGNLYFDHDRAGGWFNSSSGFGALGYGVPSAVGAALAMPGQPVVCITGDGGCQFTLAELGAAVDAGVPVIFLVWNNTGYREIEDSMRSADIIPIGVSPAPPDFLDIARAFRIPAERLSQTDDLSGALLRARAMNVPVLIEVAPDLAI